MLATATAVLAASIFAVLVDGSGRAFANVSVSSVVETHSRPLAQSFTICTCRVALDLIMFLLD